MLLTSSFNIFKFPEILNLYLSKGCEATHGHNFYISYEVPFYLCLIKIVLKHSKLPNYNTKIAFR